MNKKLSYNRLRVKYITARGLVCKQTFHLVPMHGHTASLRLHKFFPPSANENQYCLPRYNSFLITFSGDFAADMTIDCGIFSLQQQQRMHFKVRLD
jgi:hypothetical protein